MEYVFKTKTGTCTIKEDQIVLSREGVSDKVAQNTHGNSIRRTLIAYTIAGLIFFVLGIIEILENDFRGWIYLVTGGLLFYTAYASRMNSGANVIDRSSIQSVRIHKPRPPFSRGYFSVFFEQDGKTRKRLIMLPGSMNEGTEEYEQAVDLMTGLIEANIPR